MLLSLKHRFLFVHIAKTGGTSVRAALQGMRWRDPWYWPMFLCSRLSHLSGHRIASKLPRHAKVVAAKELLPRDYFDSLFKFAFVRNPWDLQVSSFHHIRRERPQFLGGHQDFEGFLRWKLDPERPYQYHVDTSIELQSDYLIDLHGAVVVDFIGRYERLGDDFSEACRRIGIREPVLPHQRKARDRKQDFRGYYTDESAQLVAEHFKRDIELLGYRFDDDERNGYTAKKYLHNTKPMALNIRNRETEQLAETIAKLTGETKTTAVTRALRDRLEKVRRQRAGRRLTDELDEIAVHCASLPVLDDRPSDEILGYDGAGMPR